VRWRRQPRCRSHIPQLVADQPGGADPVRGVLCACSAQLLHRPRNTTSTRPRHAVALRGEGSAFDARGSSRSRPHRSTPGDGGRARPSGRTSRSVGEADLADLAHCDELVQRVVDGGQVTSGTPGALRRAPAPGLRCTCWPASASITARALRRDPPASVLQPRGQSQPPQLRRSFTPLGDTLPELGIRRRKWTMLRSMIPWRTARRTPAANLRRCCRPVGPGVRRLQTGTGHRLGEVVGLPVFHSVVPLTPLTSSGAAKGSPVSTGPSKLFGS